MSDEKVFRYEGKGGTVTWDGRLCIHVGECGRATGELFVNGRKPWCEPDAVAEQTDLMEVLGRCPSGALAYEQDGVAVDEAPQPHNQIAVANNGPFYATGQLELEGAREDMPGVRYRAALCRCGESSNKPFCDNSHEGAGFRDRGAIGDAGTALASEGGPLQIKRVANGPLLLQGNLRLVAGSGRMAWTGTKAALCRCGQSGNKPFCDGSHKAAGFEAE
ncbi:MAG: CDGSH iron-sulfur domain-containing protein [Proteobacteria bacterium]|nr:CDGSH iron-sulfur domain-containing protein [Pseudomonadota bacterium]